jgi:hypothetical protein
VDHTIYGIGIGLVGGFLLVISVRYFRGTGMQFTPVGTPAAGAGFGVAFLALGLLFLVSLLPAGRGTSALDLILLGVFFLGAAMGFVILFSKPLFGWPRYGQWPNMLRRRTPAGHGGESTRRSVR